MAGRVLPAYTEPVVEVGDCSLDRMMGEGVNVLAHRSGAGANDLVGGYRPERAVMGDAAGGRDPQVAGGGVVRDRAEVDDQET